MAQASATSTTRPGARWAAWLVGALISGVAVAGSTCWDRAQGQRTYDVCAAWVKKPVGFWPVRLASNLDEKR